MVIKGISCEDEGLIQLAQNSVLFTAEVNTVLSF
jgi:hypothetical protein